MHSVAQMAVVVLLSRESGYVGILGKLGAEIERQVLGSYMDLPTDISGFEMKRYDPELGGTVEFVRMRHMVGPLADPSVIMSIPVMVQINRWDCLRSLFCPVP
jgi:hypothetical protein